MPIGIITDCICVFAGALLGCLGGKRFSQSLQQKWNILLGFCSMAIGINSIIKATNMAPVVCSVLFGFLLGHMARLEERLTEFMGLILKCFPVGKFQGLNMRKYITVVVLFCASGFGIYGTFVEAMSGDASVLMSKAVLDMITALIFAVSLGSAVLVIPFLMAIVLLLMYGVGVFVAPVVSGDMLRDFTACGGILTLAAGLRVAEIKHTEITNLIPALLLVMPLSWLWSHLPF